MAPPSIEIPVTHNENYWFASRIVNDTIRKYWNIFGRYKQSGGLHIGVEINIPTPSNSNRIKGFFARDGRTGKIYLMHDGGLGGGKKGVSRDRFLAWSSAKLVPVVDAKDEIRLGIIVSSVESGTTAVDVARFIQQALDFRQAVQDEEETVSDEETVSAIAHAQRTFKDFYDEFAGSMRRRRMKEIEYISRHGDIVRALHNWRRRGSQATERIVKNAYVDLGIQVGDRLTEIYEVKSTCDRQTLYSAIGQVVVHDNAQSGICKRFLVLPNKEEIPSDIDAALKRASIALLRFKLANGKIRILG